MNTILATNLIGNSLITLREAGGSCFRCGRVGSGVNPKTGYQYKLHIHHITYNPPKVVLLCPRCHSKITDINRKAVRLKGSSLDNSELNSLFNEFLNRGKAGVTDTTPLCLPL